MVPTTTSFPSEAGWPRRLETPLGTPVALRREFKLVVAESCYRNLVLDVLNSIENDVIHVFSPEDENAFLQNSEAASASVVQEAAASTGAGASQNRVWGTVILDRRANIPVSIREWLPVACQWIGLCPFKDEQADSYGFYRSNTSGVILPIDAEVPPLGPVGFNGYIALNSAKCVTLAKERGEDAVRLVIAHELVHAIDMLRILVPAVQDWEAFWTRVLGQGTPSYSVADFFETPSEILDQYGTVDEYLRILAFWCKERTDAWWTAFNGTPPPLPENVKVQG